MSRNFMSLLLVSCLTVAVAICFAANVQAEIVLFTDNFDDADNSQPDNGLNQNLSTRQAGSSLGTVPWGVYNDNYGYVEVNGAINPDVMKLVGPSPVGTNVNTAVVIGHNFTDSSITTAGWFELQWDMDPTSDTSKWSCASIGLPNANGNADVTNAATGFGVLLTGTGGWYSVAAGVNLGSGTYDSTPQDGEWYTFKMRVATSSFASGSSAAVDVYAGPVGGSLTLLTSQAFQWNSDGENYMGFYGYKNTSLVDNVRVTTIPEPSTLALLATGLIGLLCYARRKRK